MKFYFAFILFLLGGYGTVQAFAAFSNVYNESHLISIYSSDQHESDIVPCGYLQQTSSHLTHTKVKNGHCNLDISEREEDDDPDCINFYYRHTVDYSAVLYGTVLSIVSYPISNAKENSLGYYLPCFDANKYLSLGILRL